MQIEYSEADILSHTTICRRVEETRKKGDIFFTRFPRFGKRRWKGGKHYRKSGVAIIPNCMDIYAWPEIVKQRSRLGDWEGDLVHGVNASLVPLVDRTSRFTMAQRVHRKTKEDVADALIRMLGKIHSAMTLTLYHGGEFSDHSRVSSETVVAVYFARPYASWQRGTNEITNGRLRRFWLKRLNLATLSEQEIENGVFV